MAKRFPHIVILLIALAFSMSSLGQNVLIIYDNSATNANTLSLKSALESEGFDVTISSVSETAWNNTNPSLAGFSAVIHLNGTTYSTDMPTAGQLALKSFVEDDGGIFVGFEWNAYEVGQSRLQSMIDLVLLQRSSGAQSSMTLTQVAAQSGHPVLQGVPASFTINAGYNIGTKRTFSTDPSVVLMKHGSNDALVYRNFGEGHVLNFSHAGNYSGSSALGDAVVAQLIANLIESYAYDPEYTLDFDGTNDYASSSVVSTATNNFTIEGWVKPDAYGTGNSQLIYNGSSSTSGWGLYINSSGDLRMLYGGVANVSTSTTIPLNKWTHIALTRSSGSASVYVNGEAVLTGVTSTPNTPNTGTYIAANNLGTEYFNGQIDEVKIWEAALSQAQIRQHMCSEVPSTHINYASLEAYYRFEASSGTVLVDETSNSNDGTIYNGALWTLSGAPTGEESKFDYSGTLTLTDTSSSGDIITIDNFQGSPDGFHLYEIDHGPIHDSISNSSILGTYNDHYFGVFTVGGSSTSFDYTLDYSGNTSYAAGKDSLRVLYRDNGADTIWDNNSSSYNNDLNNEVLSLTSQVDGHYSIGYSNDYTLGIGPGNALDFDGTNDYVNAGHPEIGDDFTIEFWLNPDQISVTQNFIGKHSSTGGNELLIGYYGSVFHARVRTATTDFNVVPSAGEWQHLACVYSRTGTSTSFKGYLNGSLVNSVTLSDTITTFNGGLELLFGQDWDGSTTPTDFFDGKMDEVRIWKTDLDSTTIQDWMCQKLNENHPDYSNLSAYYNFNQFGGTALQDISGLNDGTLLNMDPSTDWVLSGAPIGDSSIAVYDGSSQLSLTGIGGDGISIDVNSGPLRGIQIYRVDEGSSSQSTSGLSALTANSYYGVRVIGTNNTYDVTADFSGNSSLVSSKDSLRLASRTDNSVTTWSRATGQLRTNTSLESIDLPNQTGTEYSFAFGSGYPERPGSGYALDFDGSNDRVDLGVYNAPDTFTVEAWINPTIQSSIRTIIGDKFSGAGTNGWALYMNSWSTTNRKLVFETTNQSIISPDNQIIGGEWQHVAAVITGTTGRIYHNGIEVGSGTVNYNTTTQEINIGSFADPAFFFDGSIDEVRFWNTAVDTNTLRDYMSQKVKTFHPNFSDLEFYYRFDEATGSILTDIAGGRDGALTNMDASSDWIVSGAPLGDTSVFAYHTLNDLNVLFETGDSLQVSNISSGASGIHAYVVDDGPINNTVPTGYTNIDTSRYFGVFTTDGSSTYNIRQLYGANTTVNGQANEAQAGLLKRGASDETTWSYAAFNTDSTDNIILNCLDTGSREFNIGFANTIVQQTAAIAKDTTVYLNSSGFALIDTGYVNDGSFDVCGIDSMWIDNDTFFCDDLGVNAVILSVRNGFGNVFTDTAYVLVADTFAPDANSQDLTVYLDENGMASIGALEAENGSTDNCQIVSYQIGVVPRVTYSSAYTFLGTYAGSHYYLSNATSTWVNAGISAQSSGGHLMSISDVQENDTIAGWLGGTTAWIGFNDTASEGTFIWTTGEPSTYTNWGPGEPNNAGAGEDCAQYRSDGRWNDLPCSANLLRHIIEIPDTLTPADSAHFTCDETDTNYIGFIVRDSANLAGVDTFIVHVLDTILPSITGTNATVYLNNSGAYNVDESDFSINYSDNCSIDSNWNNSSGTFYCADTTTSVSITFYARDPSGNIDSVTVSATISDTTPPILTTNPVTLYLDSSGIAILADTSTSTAGGFVYFTGTQDNDLWYGSLDSLGSPTLVYGNAATNGAGPVGIEYVPENDSLYYGGGNYQEVWVAATDGSSKRKLPATTTHGNEHHDVSVDFDNSRIFYTAGERGVYVANLDGSGSTTQLYDPSGNGPIGIEYDPNTSRVYLGQISLNEIGYINDDGTGYTVLYNSADGVNGPRQISIDPINEVIYWANRNANNIMAGTFAGDSAWVLYAGQNGNYGIDVHEESGTVYWTRFQGSTDRVMRGSTDGTLGPDTLFSGDFGGIRGITVGGVSSSGIYYNDNCAISNVVISPDTFYCADTAVNIANVTVTDSSGNVTSDTITVRVYDTIRPLAQAKQYNVYLDSNGAATVAADSVDSNSYDNCVLTFSLSDSVFGCGDIGDTNVWFYATDPSGNVDSQMTTLSILDTIAPIIFTNQVTVQLDSQGSVSITASLIDSATADSCGLDTIYLDKYDFDCASVGIDSLMFFAKDVNGNTDSALVYITIEDTLPPTLLVDSITVYLNLQGMATIHVDSVDTGTWDSCGIASRVLGLDSFNCANVGTNMVWFYATDVNGNSDSVQFVVTVNDTIAPTVIVQSDTFYLDSNGNYTITPGEIDNGSWDSCGIATYTLDTSVISCANVGAALLVTLNVTDVNGNVGSDTVSVIILDTVRPVAIAQDLTVYLDSSGLASITPMMVNNGSYDSCGVDSLWLDIDSFSCANIGSGDTVTLFVRDVNNNSDSAIAVITTLDTIAPEAIAKSSVTLYLDSLGSVSFSGSLLDSASWDSCGIDTFYANLSSFGCGDTGANRVALFVDDIHGNTGIDSITIYVYDTVAPHILISNKHVYLDSNGSFTINASFMDDGTWDSCGISSMSINYSTLTCAEAADSFMVEFAATDFSDNTSIDSALIYVHDTIAPTILVQSIIVALDSMGLASIDVNDLDNGSWDSCGIDTSFLNLDSFDCSTVGTNMVTLTMIDVHNNQASDSATVTIIDTIGPHVITQNQFVYLDSSGNFTLSPMSVDSGSWDSCGIVSYVLDDSLFDCSDIGIADTVTLTVTDVNGNSSSNTAIVTVLDSIAPTILTQNVTVLLDSNGEASITASQLDSATWDSCGIDTMYLSQYDFECATSGVNSVTFYAEDIHGNLDSATVLVTILELFPPTVIPKDITVALDSFGDLSITAAMVDSATFDSCGVDTIWLDQYSFNCGDVGGNTVTLYAQDLSGNIDSNQATVTVIDTIGPHLLLQSITIYVDSFGEISIDSNALDSASWDSCGIASFSVDTSDFYCSTIGDPQTVLVTAVDVNGNVSVDSAVVTVEDSIAPVVIPRILTVYLNDSGTVTFSAIQVDSASWDSCGIDSFYLDTSAFDCLDEGVNTVTLFAVDIHGNTGSNTATIIVVDTVAPTVLTFSSVSISLDSNGTYVLDPSELDSATWDSCGIASYALDTSNFSCEDTGTFVVTMTVTDIHGNSSSNTSLVTLTDTTPPTVIPHNITVYLDTGGMVSITAALVDSATSDNCMVDTIFLDEYDFECVDTTSQSVTLTAIDISGNMSSTSATVTILDTVRPIVVTQNILSYLDTNGEVTVSVSQINDGTTDNCMVDSLWLSDTLFDCDDTAAVHTITLFALDVSGNINSATATVQVFDTISPTVSAQNLTIYLDSLGSASIFPSQVDSNSLDNCGIDSSWISQNDYDCSHVGDTVTVLLFIKDVSGNVASDSSSIVALDSIAPHVITQNHTVSLDSFGGVSIDTSMINNGTWDACGVDSLWLSVDTFTCANVGLNTVTLFAMDIHGNVSSDTAVVTVLDDIAPTLVLQSIPVYLDTSGNAVIEADTFDNGTYDNCGIATFAISDTAFDCLDHNDTINITFTATDSNGNVSVDTIQVYVFDTLAPLIAAQGDTIYLDTAGQFTLDYNALDLGTSDACSIDSIYLSDSIFDCANVDSTNQIWFIAVDTFGNADSVQVGITVLDTIAPSILCPDSIVVNNDSGLCGAVVNFQWPNADDNCSIDTMIQIDSTGLDSGMIFPVGITQLSYAVFDQSGNSDTCSFIIEVVDTQAPVLVCLADTQICDSIFTFSLPPYFDNCTGLDVQHIEGPASGTFHPVGITVHRFAIADLYGNSDTCSFEVLRYDYPSQAEAGTDIELCEATSYDLNATVPGVGSGTWSILSGSGNLTDSTSNTSAINNLEIEDIQLIWTVGNGVCPVETDTLEIMNISNATQINAGNDTILCDTAATVLSAVEPGLGFGYWSGVPNGIVLSDSSVSSPIAANLGLGSYEFVWTVENGVCPKGSDTVRVEVVPYPSVFGSEDTYIFPPSSVEINATSDLATIFEWTTEAGESVGIGTEVSVSPAISTTYLVEGSTPEGCSMTDTVYVGVNIGLSLPTAFTPDNDGFNDVWNLKELANYPDCKVSVFNRWGNKMFETVGYETAWDGTFNGEQLPSGAYFFVIDLGVDNVEPISGSITIIR